MNDLSEVINYYNQFDEWGRLDREPIEFQVNCHYIKKYLPRTGSILDNGAGPGKYSVALAQEGYHMTLTDLTPKFVDMAKSKAKERNVEGQFDGFYEADARALSLFNSEQFDATLMLGPMYHIQQEEDRLKAIAELRRVTKRDGLVFVAFMPRVRHILTSLLNPRSWKPNDNMEAIDAFSRSGCFDHSNEGRFTGAYYFEVKDIKPFMENNGFETINFIGSNVGAILNQESWNYWEGKGEEEVRKLIGLLIERAEDPHVLGISSHLLYIGRRK